MMTSVAAVLALLASPAAAEPTDTVSVDVLRAMEDGVASGVNNVRNRPADLKRYTGGEVPDTCIIYIEEFNPLTVGDTSPYDERDDHSSYVCKVDAIMPTIFATIKGQENGGFTLQSMWNEMDQENNMPQVGVNWFLAVHDHYDGDKMFPDALRAILHVDEAKAAVWELELLPGKNPHWDDFAFGLKLVFNRDSTAPYTAGWYLTIPPHADRHTSSYFPSKYVAVTADIDKAVPVFMAYA